MGKDLTAYPSRPEFDAQNTWWKARTGWKLFSDLHMPLTATYTSTHYTSHRNTHVIKQTGQNEII